MEGGRKPTPLERKLLVWTGKYASDTQIPEIVPFRTFVRAKDLGRIYLAGGLGIILSGVFLYTALSGKKLVNQGNSVLEMNKNFHEEFNKTGRIGNIHELPNEFRERMQNTTKK